MATLNRDNLTFLFLIFMLFIFFSCLIEMAGTFRATLNSGNSQLVPSLRGKVFRISPLTMLIVDYFLDALNQIEEVSFYSQFGKYHK